MHFHVQIFDGASQKGAAKVHDGALCLTKPGAEHEAYIERTTTNGQPNGKRVEVKECDLNCFGSGTPQ